MKTKTHFHIFMDIYIADGKYIKSSNKVVCLRKNWVHWALGRNGLPFHCTSPVAGFSLTRFIHCLFKTKLM